MIVFLLICLIVFIGCMITAYFDSVYDEEQEQERRKLQELKRIASLKIIKCKTCGAPVHITQKCSYCDHQN